MCGRFGVTTYPDALLHRLGVNARPKGAFQPRYNVAPTQPILAVVNNLDRSVTELRWGLVPHWADNPADMKLTTFNARIETIATAPAYRDALRTKRCAIPASGYYEWRKNADGSKTPMWIHRDDGEPFAFAGLWSTWRRGDDILRSCTIITQPPTEFMSRIHSRMPVVLRSDAADEWLAYGDCDTRDLLPLLEPQDSAGWNAYAVSRRVGNVANDDPALVEPVT